MGVKKAEAVKSMGKLIVFLGVMSILTTAAPLGELYLIGVLLAVVYMYIFIKVRNVRQLYSTILFGYTYLFTYYEMFIFHASGKTVMMLVFALWFVSIVYLAALKVDPIENVTMTTLLFMSFALAHKTWIVDYNVSALVYVTFAAGLAWVGASFMKSFGVTKAFAVIAAIIIFLAPVTPSAVVMEKVFVSKGSYYLYAPIGVHDMNLTGNKSDAYLFAYDGNNIAESAKVTVLELLDNIYVYESDKLPPHLFIVIPSKYSGGKGDVVFSYSIYIVWETPIMKILGESVPRYPFKASGHTHSSGAS